MNNYIEVKRLKRKTFIDNSKTQGCVPNFDFFVICLMYKKKLRRKEKREKIERFT